MSEDIYSKEKQKQVVQHFLDYLNNISADPNVQLGYMVLIIDNFSFVISQISKRIPTLVKRTEEFLSPSAADVIRFAKKHNKKHRR